MDRFESSAPATTVIRTILTDELRLLSFRSVSPAIQTHWKAYLAFGLLFTWLAGVGRYWDNPRAEAWQLLGLGSVAYVFVLSFVLWLLLAPLRPQRWNYRNVLVFVSLTAPPAILYAIPVERFMSAAAAAQTNAWFLGIVATWRVALLGVFLRRVARLDWLALIVATLLPLAIIVVVLALLNLEHVVFDIMAGIRPEDKSANDTAYMIVFMLGVISYVSAPFLGVLYVFCIYRAWRRTRNPVPAGE